MKNIHDVLRIKEQQVQQLQREIEALRVAVRILAEESDAAPAARAASASNGTTPGMSAPPMVMRPAQPVSPVAAPKDSGSYVSASAWDVSKPQFP